MLDDDPEKLPDDEHLAEWWPTKKVESKAKPIRLDCHLSGGPLKPQSWIKGVLEILTNTFFYDIVLKCA